MSWWNPRTWFPSEPAEPVAKRSYAGAGTGRRWGGHHDIPALVPAMNAARGPLAKRARHLETSNPLAASAVTGWASALVGTGIKPQSAHGDPDTRAALNLAFEAWTDHADADGLGDFYALQGLLVRRLVVDGESFALLIVDEDRRRLSIRLIDPEQVDSSLTRPLPGGGLIVQGIELDASGRRVAYHILPQRPGHLYGSYALTPQRVPAEDVIHLFRPDSPGQVRGISWFAPVLLRLADLDAWRDAQLVRQKVAALLTGFVTSGELQVPTEDYDDYKNAPALSLEPGILRHLAPGEDIRFSEPANIGAEVIDFARITEREIAVGLGLPASLLTGDLSDVNYSSIRAGLVEFRRRVEAIQHGVIAFQALRPIWRRWAALEVMSGRVATTVEAAEPVTWIMPRQPWVDPLKDIQAELMAIEGGLMSRREAVTTRGVDIEALDQDIADDNARAAALGLSFAANTNTQEVNHADQ